MQRTNKYGKGLGHRRRTILPPVLALPIRSRPSLVARGGFGLFYNGFENRGYFPNLGENYPFQFQFNFQSGSQRGQLDSIPSSITTRRFALRHRRTQRNREPGDWAFLHSV